MNISLVDHVNWHLEYENQITVIIPNPNYASSQNQKQLSHCSNVLVRVISLFSYHRTQFVYSLDREGSFQLELGIWHVVIRSYGSCVKEHGQSRIPEVHFQQDVTINITDSDIKITSKIRGHRPISQSKWLKIKGVTYSTSWFHHSPTF